MTDDLIYINANEITFFKTAGKLLGAEYGEYRGRVNVVRTFPVSDKNEYLSVRDSDYKELGIIKDLKKFDGDQRALVEEELRRRYFAPEITKVYDANEEFGRILWDCMTSAGKREFVMRDPANNLLRSNGGGVILIDIDGNRYTIRDPRAMGKKAMRILEIWL